MMRGGQAQVQAPVTSVTRPTVTREAETESPAKRMKRDSASLDQDAPVSPPPSSLPPQGTERPCRSECSFTQACSEEGRLMINWTVDQVVEFIADIDDVKEHAAAFAREKIDGSTLVLLTDSHLTSLGIKLGPAIRLR